MAILTKQTVVALNQYLVKRYDATTTVQLVHASLTPMYSGILALSFPLSSYYLWHVPVFTGQMTLEEFYQHPDLFLVRSSGPIQHPVLSDYTLVEQQFGFSVYQKRDAM